MKKKNAMFQSIKDSLNKESGSNSSFKDFIKANQKGKTYKVRLLPFIEDPDNTFFHFYEHGWKSLATGQYQSHLSPATFEEPDPISEVYFKLKNGTQDEQDLADEHLRRRESWLVNVYVVDDPVTPENNGTVKIWRIGRKLKNIISRAVDGDEADEFGVEKVFDLTDDGATFKVIVEDQGGWPNYDQSRFTTAIKTGLSEEKAMEFYKQAHDLTKVFQVKSYDDLTKVLDEHFFCKSPADKAYTPPKTVEAKAAAKAEPEAEPEAKKKEEEDDVPTDYPDPGDLAESDADLDAKAQELLAGIDD